MTFACQHCGASGEQEFHRPGCVTQEFHNLDDMVEIRRLKQELSLAEEGLANYAQELANARHDIERLTAACSAEATEVERLKVHMRNVAGWLNNGCEPAKGAAELLLIAGLPPTPLG